MEKLVRQIIDNLASVPRPKNWALMLLSFFFALFLWYFVVGEDKVDMNVTIPVEIVNLPRDLVISNQFKKQLEVTISGQRSLIRALTEQHISRSIDLSDATPGTVVKQNQPDSIKLPRGLSILRIQPPTLTLLLDQLIQKELSIKPILVGKVDQDYMLGSVIPDPPTLAISGPQAVLGKAQILNTIPIDISGMKESTVKQVPLDLQLEIADLIGEPIVGVRINIVELKKEVKLSDIPVEFDHTGGKATETIYQIKPPTITITAEIPQRMIQNPGELKSLFQAKINPETLKSSTLKLKLQVDAPPQIKILSVSPDTVTLEIKETRKLKIKK
ncbi:MAG: CdaR family protein [Desulfobulbaceae bacterium]|nr:CdaR family protein [Desulfobulbaceae bacterium]